MLVERAVRRRLPPGPPPRPSNLLWRYTSLAIDASRHPLSFIGDRFARYGDIYHVPEDAGLFVLSHPEHIHEVLVSKASAYHKTHSVLDRLKAVLGEGLLTSDGDTWKRHRRMIGPAFQRKALEGYASAMVDEALATRETWDGGGVRDVGEDMMALTLRIVSRTLFGHDASAEVGVVAGAMEAFHDGLEPSFAPSWVPTPRRIRVKRAVQRLDGIIFDMITQRRANQNEGNDLLGRLLRAVDDEGDGTHFTEKEVRDELVTLFLAGHETTAQLLTWTWYLLARNPQVRDALWAELDEVLAGQPPTLNDLDRLPYNLQVIKEAMRVYPPAYLLARRAVSDTSIGGYEVASNTEVVIWTYMTHHDPRWYPEPEEFRPERFTPAAEAGLRRGAYLPFGAGPRACIGRSFALMEAQLLLAALAQKHELDTISAVPVKTRPRITLTPEGGMPMHVPRQGKPVVPRDERQDLAPRAGTAGGEAGARDVILARLGDRVPLQRLLYLGSVDAVGTHGVAAEDLSLDGPGQRRVSETFLEFGADLEGTKRLDLVLRRAEPDGVGAPQDAVLAQVHEELAQNVRGLVGVAHHLAPRGAELGVHVPHVVLFHRTNESIHAAVRLRVVRALGAVVLPARVVDKEREIRVRPGGRPDVSAPRVLRVLAHQRQALVHGDELHAVSSRVVEDTQARVLVVEPPARPVRPPHRVRLVRGDLPLLGKRSHVVGELLGRVEPGQHDAVDA